MSRVWDAAKPNLLIHGHMHIPAGGVAEDGRRVCSLGADGRYRPGISQEVPGLLHVRESPRTPEGFWFSTGSGMIWLWQDSTQSSDSRLTIARSS